MDYSVGTGWTPVELVAAAAADAGVLVRIDGENGTPEHRQVVVTAHDGHWSVHRDRESILGWVACRLDPTGWPIPGTLCWIGASDLEPDSVVHGLLGAVELPTDLRGHEPAVRLEHPMRQDRPSSTYLLCEACGWVAEPSSADYAVRADGDPDLAVPVSAVCGVCGHRIVDARGWAVPRDVDQPPCPRCRTVTRAPAHAARVCCVGCGLRNLGGGLSDDDLDALAGTEAARG